MSIQVVQSHSHTSRAPERDIHKYVVTCKKGRSINIDGPSTPVLLWQKTWKWAFHKDKGFAQISDLEAPSARLYETLWLRHTVVDSGLEGCEHSVKETLARFADFVISCCFRLTTLNNCFPRNTMLISSEGNTFNNTPLVCIVCATSCVAVSPGWDVVLAVL